MAVEALRWLEELETRSIKLEGQPQDKRGATFLHQLYGCGAEEVVLEEAPNEATAIDIALDDNPVDWREVYEVMAVVARAHPKDVSMIVHGVESRIIISVDL